MTTGYTRTFYPKVEGYEWRPKSSKGLEGLYKIGNFHDGPVVWRNKDSKWRAYLDVLNDEIYASDYLICTLSTAFKHNLIHRISWEEHFVPSNTNTNSESTMKNKKFTRPSYPKVPGCQWLPGRSGDFQEGLYDNSGNQIIRLNPVDDYYYLAGSTTSAASSPRQAVIDACLAGRIHGPIDLYDLFVPQYEFEPGDEVRVSFDGGKRIFISKSYVDPNYSVVENPNPKGRRNLTCVLISELEPWG